MRRGSWTSTLLTPYQNRAFSKTNFVLADGKLIILDEDGNLALATASPTEPKVIRRRVF